MSSDLPSFDKAQYSFTPATSPDQYTRCQQPIAGSYYRINGDLACNLCANQARSDAPTDSHASYVRAILFGIGAAIVGMVLYALFEIMTGIIIGYLAIGVGYFVGKAMKYGSSGRGGRRYQIATALLTYALVSMAAVPVHASITHKHTQSAQVASSSDSNHNSSGDSSR